MTESRRTRSSRAAATATDLIADSIEVQITTVEEDGEEDEEEELGGEREDQRDSKGTNNNADEDEGCENDENGEGVTGTGTDIQVEEKGHQVRGHSTQIERILNSVHQVWNITNINDHLAPNILPADGIWTERPAKQLSKLAHATTVHHRTWALDQLHQCAGEKPLTKSIIEQVYQKAEEKGKIFSQRSSSISSARAASREAATIPDTPQAQRRQQNQQHSWSHSWRPSRPSRPSRLAAEVSTRTSRHRQRAASTELGDALSSPSPSPPPSPPLSLSHLHSNELSPLCQPQHTEQSHEDGEREGELNEMGLLGSLVCCSFELFVLFVGGYPEGRALLALSHFPIHIGQLRRECSFVDTVSQSRILRDSRDRRDQRDRRSLRDLRDLPPPPPFSGLTSTNTHIAAKSSDTTLVCTSSTTSSESQSLHSIDPLYPTQHTMQRHTPNGQTASQAIESPRTSSPFPATAVNFRSSSRKRTYSTYDDTYDNLLEAAVENRRIELARTRNRINTLEAQKTELIFDLGKSDADLQSVSDCDIPTLKARQAELQRILLSMQQFLATCDVAFQGGGESACQALTECEHEKTPSRASVRRDSVMAPMDTAREGGRASEPSDFTTTPSRLPEDCPACYLARWKATCRARLSALEQQALEVQNKLEEAEVDRLEHVQQSQVLREQIMAVESEVEEQKLAIMVMEDAISSLGKLSKQEIEYRKDGSRDGEL